MLAEGLDKRYNKVTNTILLYIYFYGATRKNKQSKNLGTLYTIDNPTDMYAKPKNIIHANKG